MEMNDVFFVLKFVLALFVAGIVGYILFIILFYIVVLLIRFILFSLGFLVNLSFMNPYIKQHLKLIGSNMNYEDYIETVERDERKTGKSSGKRISREYEHTGLEKEEEEKKDKKKKKKKKK